MQIVIDIPRKEYNAIKTFGVNENQIPLLAMAIINGMTLPKGHGDLVDRNDILPYMELNLDMQELYLPIHFKELVVDEMSTVIPADKEDAE